MSEALRCFAVTILTEQVQDAEMLATAAAHAREAAESTADHRVSNRGRSWHSPVEWHGPGAPLARLCDVVTSRVTEGLRRNSLLAGTSVVVAASAWCIVTRRGGWIAPHRHVPFPWSAVLYLDVDASLAAEADDRAGRIEFQNPLPTPELFGQPAGVVVKPRDGLLLAFPGALTHFVHPTASDVPRVAASFNFQLAPERVALARSTAPP